MTMRTSVEPPDSLDATLVCLSLLCSDYLPLCSHRRSSIHLHALQPTDNDRMNALQFKNRLLYRIYCIFCHGFWPNENFWNLMQTGCPPPSLTGLSISFDSSSMYLEIRLPRFRKPSWRDEKISYKVAFNLAHTTTGPPEASEWFLVISEHSCRPVCF